MDSFAARIRVFALGLGAPGLFLIAALDSSFLSLPEIADLLVVYMVTQHKAQFILYAASATLGSLTGCLGLYYIGRRGGDALVRRRFAPTSVERTLGVLRHYGLLAVLIPSILPPPAPFKIFVLLAGAAGISASRFTLAILIGRGFRYLLLALLAVRYGDFAMSFLREHAATVATGVVGTLALGLLVYLWWSRARKRKHP